MKLIISATDGSESAERAVAVAAKLAKSVNAKLLIVYVDQHKFADKQIHLIDQYRLALGDVLEEFGRRILARATSIAQDHGATDVETMSGDGEPAEVVMDIAAREHVDAIVVGRRGRGRLEGLLLGSVSQKLSSLAQCIVIIVP